MQHQSAVVRVLQQQAAMFGQGEPLQNTAFFALRVAKLQSLLRNIARG